MASRILCKSMRMAVMAGQKLSTKTTPSQLGRIMASVGHQASYLSTSSQLRASSEVSKKLTTFISEEIKLETDSRKNKSQAVKITGFDVKTEGPVVTLTKTHGGDEQITIVFNVNGSLDDEPQFDQQQSATEKNENQSDAEVSYLIF